MGNPHIMNRLNFRNTAKALTLCGLILFILPSWAQGADLGTKGHPIRMMFVPSGDTEVILEGGQEIATQLNALTGLHFKTTVATSYAAVIEAMGAGKADVGWLAAFSYVLAKDKYDVEILLTIVRFGSPFYRGQILAGAQSGIQTLADLKGKKFAFGDPASTSGHLYPKTLLLAQGYNPETFFAKTVFAGSHNAVVLSILKGEVDGGATYDDARAIVAKDFPDVYDKIKVIAYTEDIPNEAISVRKGLAPDLKLRIKEGLKALSKTPEGKKALKQTYSIGGLMDLDALFDPVRKAGKVLGLDLENLSRKAPK